MKSITNASGKTTHYADDVDQTSVNNPTLEKLSILSARLEFVEKLLDEQYLRDKKEKKESSEK